MTEPEKWSLERVDHLFGIAYKNIYRLAYKNV